MKLIKPSINTIEMRTVPRETLKLRVNTYSQPFGVGYNETITHTGETIMRSNVTLKNGRIVAHRLFDNGATEAFMQDGGNMSNEEWLEYVSLTTPTFKRKPTWNEIKDSKNIIIGIDYAKEDTL